MKCPRDRSVSYKVICLFGNVNLNEMKWCETEPLIYVQKKSNIDMLLEYSAALKDVSYVENFQNKWGAVGLKEDQFIDHGKGRTLSIDYKDFSKCNFWALPFKGEYIIYAGRTLRSNAAALTANDSRWAKEIFEGIFEMIPEEEFSTKSVAFASRVGDVFTIRKPGSVIIPARNN